jgi:hypothetical protein
MSRWQCYARQPSLPKISALINFLLPCALVPVALSSSLSSTITSTHVPTFHGNGATGLLGALPSSDSETRQNSQASWIDCPQTHERDIGWQGRYAPEFPSSSLALESVDFASACAARAINVFAFVESLYEIEPRRFLAIRGLASPEGEAPAFGDSISMRSTCLA